jgi:hypothetical protein
VSDTCLMNGRSRLGSGPTRAWPTGSSDWFWSGRGGHRVFLVGVLPPGRSRVWRRAGGSPVPKRRCDVGRSTQTSPTGARSAMAPVLGPRRYAHHPGQSDECESEQGNRRPPGRRSCSPRHRSSSPRTARSRQHRCGFADGLTLVRLSVHGPIGRGRPIRGRQLTLASAIASRLWRSKCASGVVPRARPSRPEGPRSSSTTLPATVWCGHFSARRARPAQNGRGAPRLSRHQRPASGLLGVRG